MRRVLLMSMGTLALAIAVPGTALAHGDHARHHHHHHHRAHHAKFRHVHIGAGSSSGNPSPAPVTGTPTPPVSMPENAGTVASYANGVLTLTLGDGSTVNGKVTADTRIGCIHANPAPTPEPAGQPGVQGPGDGKGPGEDKGSGEDQDRGDMDQGEHGSGPWQEGGQGKDNDHEGQAPGVSEPPCDSSALVSGAIVRAAELRIGPGGSVFESIWLVR
ncbi:MAG TPA: hypothetical protein VK781_08650 [Solirubrobacteraceae bacterium]|jgi:hypothetical protein|nr:hypothetical protein [Solirubrobacteraceae bacterium]